MKKLYEKPEAHYIGYRLFEYVASETTTPSDSVEPGFDIGNLG